MTRTRALAMWSAVTLAAGALSLVIPATGYAAVAGQLRVDQVGFLPGDTKQAYLMTSAAVSGETFSVIDSAGSTVLTGNVGSTSRGSWNSGYPDVYPISFSGLSTSGTYHLQVSGTVSVSSPTFTVESAGSLFGKLVSDGVTFFQNQRDGSNVIAGALNRQPSHLNDATASVYAVPSFESGGSDVITNSSLTKIGGPVNVEGGWFDAGDFLKFSYTSAYADVLLSAAQRGLGPAAPASLGAEAHYGESWLNQMWDQSTKTLYIQVGIGSGNSAGTFLGDHDLWRLPQADDSDTSSLDRYAAAHRPVFEAAAAGSKISPNLAGLMAAAFALTAQNDAASNPTQAATEYTAATSIYAMANTSSPPSPLVTTEPNAYYPASIWHDDMELGAAELALAAQALGHDASTYLSQAATWASDYIASDTGDTFNLYDTSALAHADLIKAMDNAGDPSGLAVSRSTLVSQLKTQVSGAASKAASDIFHAGGNYADFDVDSHTFGFITTEALYQKITGDSTYAAFATEQRDWLLGANAWGTSFMVGEGHRFPYCMQHQVANLSGSTNGSAPVDTGAVVNGPNGSSNFSGGLGGYQTGMVACPAGGSDPFSAFDGHSSEYVDDVRSWQTDEPALDMTGGAVLAAALQEALNGGSGGGGCTAAQLMGNPGFENGTAIAPWTQTSTLGQAPINNDTVDEPAHSGSWDAWLNGDGSADTDTVSQTVTIPAGCATAAFSFWLHIDTTENTTTNADDKLKVQVINSAGTVLATLATYSNLNAASGYSQKSFSLAAYAGQTITIKFTGTETDSNGGTTSFVIDDTALNVS